MVPEYQRHYQPVPKMGKGRDAPASRSRNGYSAASNAPTSKAPMVPEDQNQNPPSNWPMMPPGLEAPPTPVQPHYNRERGQFYVPVFDSMGRVGWSPYHVPGNTMLADLPGR